MKTTGLAILFATCALAIAQPASAATTHYVSPTGSGTTCSEALPCDFTNSVAGLVSGDTIVVGSGAYDLGTGSLSVPSGVSLVGAPGPRPSLTSDSIGATVQLSGGSARHLAITQTNSSGLALGSFGSTLEDLVVTSAGSGASLSAGDVLRDSVVRVTGTSGSAIQTVGIGSLDMRNVLIWAPEPSTVGIQAYGNCFPMPNGNPDPSTWLCLPIAQPTVNVRNSIVRAGTDLITSGVNGYNGVINIAYSDYRAAKTTAFPAGTIVDGGGNIEGDPLFADAAAGDFHQLAGSPTIDAGDPLASSDSNVGSLDLDGLTRIVGGRVDMGPLEFVPAQTTDNGGGSQQQDGGSQQQGGDSGTPSGTPAPSAGPAAGGAVADTTAPVLRSLRIAPGLLRKSALVSYLASENATTSLNVQRKTAGVKKGTTCAKEGRKLKKGAKACIRWVAVKGTLVRTDRAGKNSFRWNGKLRGKRLAAGGYRLVAVARDAAGNVGKQVTVSFRVRAH